METLVGRKLGQYQIVSEIGRGGMAVVYRAHQPLLGRFVAIKVPMLQFTDDALFVARFLAEARVAAGLKHPNIVTIHDVGMDNGVYFIVMEEIEGRSLKAIIENERPLTTEFLLSTLRQVAAALDSAHAGGVVHRDVKPANILAGRDGHIKLTDFGIAKAASGTGLTRSGLIVGTPEYMSPEQAMGKGVDHRSDIYSLAVICYELLAGRPPYTGDVLAVVHAHVFGQPPSLRALNPRLTLAIERVVSKAMARKPADRYHTAGSFVHALTAAVADRRLTPPPSPSASARRPTPPPVSPAASPAASGPTAIRPLTTPQAPPPTLSSGGDPAAAGLDSPRQPPFDGTVMPVDAVPLPMRRSPVWLLLVAGALFGAILILAAVVRPRSSPTPTGVVDLAPTTPASSTPVSTRETIATASGTAPSSLVSTHTPAVSATPRATPTSTTSASATQTATRSPTATHQPGSPQATNTPARIANTATPPPTDTPVPFPTDTPAPLPTDTPVPLPTDTPVPLPTDTPVPLPID